MTTIMQPLQCDLQPQIEETQRTTHTGTTTRCRTQRRNPLRRERPPQPKPPHTRGTFHRRLQPLYTKKFKVSCSGFLPKTNPCNMHAAITIRFAASRSKPASLYAHGNTRWQQSCSHSNAICNHRFKNRIELRNIDTTTRCRTQRRNPLRPERPQPQLRHTRGTFHRRLQPLYTEKYRVSCSGFLPKTKPMQHACSHYNTFRSIP